VNAGDFRYDRKLREGLIQVGLEFVRGVICRIEAQRQCVAAGTDAQRFSHQRDPSHAVFHEGRGALRERTGRVRLCQICGARQHCEIVDFVKIEKIALRIDCAITPSALEARDSDAPDHMLAAVPFVIRSAVFGRHVAPIDHHTLTQQHFGPFYPLKFKSH
jgi:hypothetical protein